MSEFDKQLDTIQANFDAGILSADDANQVLKKRIRTRIIAGEDLTTHAPRIAEMKRRWSAILAPHTGVDQAIATASAGGVEFQGPEIDRWKHLLILVPATRTESSSDSFWKSRLSEVSGANPALGSELQAKDFLSLRPERRLEILREIISQAYFALLQRGMASAISSEKEIVDRRIDELIKPPSVRTMTLEEVVQELSQYGIYQDQPRILELLNAFEERLGDVRESDEPKKSRLVNYAAVTDSAIQATSQKRDFAANVNKVVGPFVGRNGSVTTLALGYFFKGETDHFGVKEAVEGRVQVNTRIIQVWEYMKKRIADKPEHGGIPRAVILENGTYRDATGGYVPRLVSESEQDYQNRLRKIFEIDQTFSYNTLNEQVIDNFTAQVKLIFSDIPSDLLSSFMLFCQTFGVKSAGYMPWLIRGATRGHGFKPQETETKDESRYVNPYALRMYQATRYDQFTFARYMTIFLMVDKTTFLDIVRQNKESKVEEAREFYELIESFGSTKWGSTQPLWLTDTRKLFSGTNPRVNLNGCIFPLLPEVFTNTLGAEAEKDKLLADFEVGRISEAEFNIKVDTFIERYRYQGYFPKHHILNEVLKSGDRRRALKLMRGKMTFFASGDPDNPSSNLDLGQYQLAAAAVEAMFDKFDKPLKMGMTEEEVKKEVLDWNNKIIGKAKLVPGPHQQLFAPLTCQLISQLIYCYQFSGDVDKVNTLYREIIIRVKDPSGLPEFVSAEIVRLFSGMVDKAPSYMVHASHLHETLLYNARINKRIKKHNLTLGARVSKIAPIGFGERRSPYEFDEVVSKDTTSKTEEG